MKTEWGCQECPNCGKPQITTEQVTASFDYGSIKNAFTATFPVMRCEDCLFGWRDYRAEIAIDTAMNAFVNNEPAFTRADEEALSAEADYWSGITNGDAP